MAAVTTPIHHALRVRVGGQGPVPSHPALPGLALLAEATAAPNGCRWIRS